MQFKNIRDSVQLSFDTFGDIHAPLMLLIPGAGAPAEFWPEPFCRNLASRGRCVVRYSQRDTGFSTHFEQTYPIDELLLDLMALVGALENPTVHLVGHSMGGYLAQMALCRYSEMLESVTSVSAGPTVTPEVAGELGLSQVSEATWQILMKNRPTGVFDADLPGWLGVWQFLNGATPFDEESAIGYTRALYAGDPRNAQVAVNHIHAMSTVPSSLAEELKHVHGRFLVIHGTEDPLVPLDHGEASARLVPNSKMVRLQRAGHMFFARETWDEIGEMVVLQTSDDA